MDRQNKLRTIFMGTPDFSVPILEALIKSDFIEVIAIICNQDKPIGRKQILTPPPVKQRIMNYESRIKNKIQILQPDKIRKSEWIEKIKNLKPELIIVAAFGQIIPKEILDIPKYKTINVHSSLLPKLRGASPIQYAILEGYDKTGVTIMLVDELMDHGPILSQKEINIAPKETSETLSQKISQISASFLIDTLKLWINGKIQPQEQNHNEMTLTKILKKEDGKINWADPAETIERQIRAFNIWPGTFCFFRDQDGKEKRLKILEADINSCANKKSENCGFLFTDEKNNLLVKTSTDCLKLIKIQLEGKNQMSATEFINGHLFLINKILE